MGRARAKGPIPPSPPEAKRLRWVEQRLARGMRPTVLMEAIRAEFGVGESTAWELIRRVRDRWAKEAESSRPENRAALIAQAHELLELAWKTKSPKEIRGALGLLADLYGLRLRAVVVKDDSGALTAEEREAIAAMLHQRPADGG